MIGNVSLDRRRNGHAFRSRSRFFVPILLAKELLDPADGIAFLVEQAVDSPREVNVCGPVVAAVTRALHGLQLRKARFPIAEDVLGDPQLARQFADRQ